MVVILREEAINNEVHLKPELTQMWKMQMGLKPLWFDEHKKSDYCCARNALYVDHQKMMGWEAHLLYRG